MIKKLGISLFFISLSAFGKLNFTMDHFSRNNEVSELQAQRTAVQFSEQKKVDENIDLQLDVTAIYSFVNSEQFFARDEERDLGIDIQKFLVQYGESFGDKTRLTFHLGVQPTGSLAAASENIAGPGFKISTDYAKTLSFTTGIYTIPSFRQFFINKTSDGENSQLWSNELRLNYNITATDKVIMGLGYDFFLNLGPDAAFQSGLRGNSTSGIQIDSEFLFDYSIVSGMLGYEKKIKSWTLFPYVKHSNNISAYDAEATYSKLGIDLANRGFKLSLAALEIQKNALVSIYTPEYIDSTDVRGYELGFSSRFRKSFTLASRLASFDNEFTESKQESLLISLTYHN